MAAIKESTDRSKDPTFNRAPKGSALPRIPRASLQGAVKHSGNACDFSDNLRSGQNSESSIESSNHHEQR